MTECKDAVDLLYKKCTTNRSNAVGVLVAVMTSLLLYGKSHEPRLSHPAVSRSPSHDHYSFSGTSKYFIKLKINKLPKLIIDAL